MNILAISGSLRKDSYNTMLARAFQQLAPAGMTVEIADLSGLSLYDQDAETAFPAPAQEFKNKILAADGIILVTPEYNRSVSAALKNAVDWASRPYGQNAFAGKPVLISGVSVGKVGTAVAQSHLRTIMLYLDAQVIGQPELYLGPASELFDAQGAISQESTKDLLKKALGVLASRIGG